MTTCFTPGAGAERAFRDALGRYATGVTVVTAPGPVGITANSFASVSLDPPMVLWSPAKASTRCPAFTQPNQHFAIHVMGAEQSGVCMPFVRDGRAFDGLDWSESPHGVPLLQGCLARFECQTAALHDGGDHVIVLAHVLACEMRDGAPMLFQAGRYGGFTPI